MIPEVGKYYWVREYNIMPWEPAQRVQSELAMGVDYCWKVIGNDNEIPDMEVAEVGPEIVPPPL